MVRLLLAVLLATLIAAPVAAQPPVVLDPEAEFIDTPGVARVDQKADNEPVALLGLGGPDEWTKPERLSSSLQVMLLLTVISLAPAALLMTTSFVRIIVVLGLLRQALGTQQAPPGQVLTSIALFVTLLIMTPVWNESYTEGVKPYTDGELTLEEAFQRAAAPLRDFMGRQIKRTDSEGDVVLFLERLPDAIDPDTGAIHDNYALYEPNPDEQYVPLAAVLPAYMLSELKTAFLIGFQIYLPFVILDIVVASVTISMGMLMLPPVLVSLPFKLLLFVLVDGWRLVIGMLLESFA
ncbi:flagellar type III secretion system pore protein FliP [Botrimarina sp.]|uniref:flagellar type III secretion system pore protein FliP n=1 Tax=Botrimarina sp. TaxID=2795802 RepID=UPI0032EB18B1